jgi:hypothetical protein
VKEGTCFCVSCGFVRLDERSSCVNDRRRRVLPCYLCSALAGNWCLGGAFTHVYHPPLSEVFLPPTVPPRSRLSPHLHSCPFHLSFLHFGPILRLNLTDRATLRVFLARRLYPHIKCNVRVYVNQSSGSLAEISHLKLKAKLSLVLCHLHFPRPRRVPRLRRFTIS